jgi:hypothetical protein
MKEGFALVVEICGCIATANGIMMACAGNIRKLWNEKTS